MNEQQKPPRDKGRGKQRADLPAEQPKVEASVSRDTRLPLPTHLTREGLLPFMNQLSSLLREPPPLTLDPSALVELDGAGLEALLSLHATALEGGHPVELLSASPVLEELTRLTGWQGIPVREGQEPTP